MKTKSGIRWSLNEKVQVMLTYLRLCRKSRPTSDAEKMEHFENAVLTLPFDRIKTYRTISDASADLPVWFVDALLSDTNTDSIPDQLRCIISTFESAPIECPDTVSIGLHTAITHAERITTYLGRKARIDQLKRDLAEEEKALLELLPPTLLPPAPEPAPVVSENDVSPEQMIQLLCTVFELSGKFGWVQLGTATDIYDAFRSKLGESSAKAHFFFGAKSLGTVMAKTHRQYQDGLRIHKTSGKSVYSALPDVLYPQPVSGANQEPEAVSASALEEPKPESVIGGHQEPEGPQYFMSDGSKAYFDNIPPPPVPDRPIGVYMLGYHGSAVNAIRSKCKGLIDNKHITMRFAHNTKHINKHSVPDGCTWVVFGNMVSHASVDRAFEAVGKEHTLKAFGISRAVECVHRVAYGIMKPE